VVIVSGGLGPTADDVTKPAVAAMLGLELRLDQDLLDRLEAYFRSRGFERMPALNRTQAEIPEGATLLRNPQGTAQGIALASEGRWVVLLPGVPRELRAIFEGDLREFLREKVGERAAKVRHRTLHTTGVAESKLAELVDAVLPADMGPVTLAYLPDLRGVDLRLSTRGVSAAEAESALARVEAAIAPVVAPWRFEAESGDIVEAHAEGTVRRLRPKIMTVTTMAAGLLPLLWADGPGSEISRRVAAPMIGGLVTSAFLTLEVLPVLYTIWRQHQLRRAQRRGVPIEAIVGRSAWWQRQE